MLRITTIDNGVVESQARVGTLQSPSNCGQRNRRKMPFSYAREYVNLILLFDIANFFQWNATKLSPNVLKRAHCN